MTSYRDEFVCEINKILMLVGYFKDNFTNIPSIDG